MRLYVGVDLHTNNNFVAVVDRKGKRRYQKKLPNDLPVILEFLTPCKKEIAGFYFNGRDFAMPLILMGDWCSESYNRKPKKNSATMEMLITDFLIYKKSIFSCSGEVFALDRGH